MVVSGCLCGRLSARVLGKSWCQVLFLGLGVLCFVGIGYHAVFGSRWVLVLVGDPGERAGGGRRG
jgi:hypothetical protein